MARFTIKLVEQTSDTTPETVRNSVITYATDNPGDLHQPGASDEILKGIRDLREPTIICGGHLQTGVRVLPEDNPYNRTLYTAGRIRQALQQAEHLVSLDLTHHVVSDIKEVLGAAAIEESLL
jgi:hypothetical protein